MIRLEMTPQSDRKIRNEQGIIGTEILDANLPSELEFGNKNKAGSNPETSGRHASQTDEAKLKKFTVVGKGSNMPAKYEQNQIVSAKIDTLPAKAFDEQKSGGLKSIWESLIGFTKKQLLIEDGYIYIFQATREGLKRMWAENFNNIINIFVDIEDNSMRIVFKNENGKRITKDYQFDDITKFQQKLVQQAKAIGFILKQQHI